MSTSAAESTSTAQAFVDRFNADYETKHEAFEQQFWGTKMALANTDETTYSAENLTKTKTEMENLLSDPDVGKQAETLKKQVLDGDASVDTDLVKTLDIIIRTCRCYDMSSAPEAKKLREETLRMESELEMARNEMQLGYTLLDGSYHPMSSTGLRNEMRTSNDEAIRKAAYEGLRSVGPFVLDNGFVEIIKLRNKMAKSLGFIDYYDYKVTNAEGFGKAKLFEILDGLETGTRSIMVSAREELAKRHGEDALEPWNISFKMAGSIVVKQDPYFPFATAVERYVRSYAALGITYQGATMNLDLLDRPKKFSNGFCHWPKPVSALVATDRVRDVIIHE
jgi:hypothetical protein